MSKYTISQFTMPDGNIIELKDKVAREAVAGGTHFLGVTSTELVDGSTTSTITIAGESVTAANGDIVVYGVKEFIYAVSDTAWHELGDVSMLGDLALKDSASGTYTPAGSVSSTFTGTDISYTPAGTVSFTGGTVSSTGSFTPEGTVSTPDITVTPTTATIAEFDSAGSVVAGTAASAVMPTLSFTPDASTENLTIAWTDGSFTANTPTSVTLPTSKNTSVMTAASAALASAPSFTGSAGSVSVSGTAAGTATFTGTAATLEVAGSVSSTFAGTAATITVE